MATVTNFCSGGRGYESCALNFRCQLAIVYIFSIVTLARIGVVCEPKASLKRSVILLSLQYENIIKFYIKAYSIAIYICFRVNCYKHISYFFF